MKIEIKYPQRGDSVCKKDTICGSIEMDDREVDSYAGNYEIVGYERGKNGQEKVFNSVLFVEKLPNPISWLKVDCDGKLSYKRPFTKTVDFSKNTTLLEVAVCTNNNVIESTTVKIRIRK